MVGMLAVQITLRSAREKTLFERTGYFDRKDAGAISSADLLGYPKVGHLDGSLMCFLKGISHDNLIKVSGIARN